MPLAGGHICGRVPVMTASTTAPSAVRWAYGIALSLKKMDSSADCRQAGGDAVGSRSDKDGYSRQFLDAS